MITFPLRGHEVVNSHAAPEGQTVLLASHPGCKAYQQQESACSLSKNHYS